MVGGDKGEREAGEEQKEIPEHTKLYHVKIVKTTEKRTSLNTCLNALFQRNGLAFMSF